MNHLTRDDILNIDDIHLEQVEVNEWGGVIHIKPLNVQQRDRLSDMVTNTNPGKNSSPRGMVVIWCVCDEQGKSLFKEEDLPSLNSKNATPVEKIYQRVAKISGLTDDYTEMVKKNSD